jgi:Flp pilus assembly protein TadD
VAGLAAIAQPLWGAVALERSYDAAADGRLDDALDGARAAASAQRYAATPLMQEALLLEWRGDVQAAVRAARKATEHEPTNSLSWSVLAEIQARSGNRSEAAEARRRARELM